MKTMRILKGAAVSLAVLGMVIPGGTATAAKRVNENSRAAAPAITDVALSGGGTFTGRVVDEQGVAVADAAVVFRQGEREVARTFSDRNGAVSVRSLRGGVYQVSAGQGTGVYRLWSKNTAPPAAVREPVLVTGSAVRGQYPGMDPATLIIVGGVITAVVLSAVAISQNNDIKDDLDQVPKSP